MQHMHIEEHTHKSNMKSHITHIPCTHIIQFTYTISHITYMYTYTHYVIHIPPISYTCHVQQHIHATHTLCIYDTKCSRYACKCTCHTHYICIHTSHTLQNHKFQIRLTEIGRANLNIDDTSKLWSLRLNEKDKESRNESASLCSLQTHCILLLLPPYLPGHNQTVSSGTMAQKKPFALRMLLSGALLQQQQVANTYGTAHVPSVHTPHAQHTSGTHTTHITPSTCLPHLRSEADFGAFGCCTLLVHFLQTSGQ